MSVLLYRITTACEIIELGVRQLVEAADDGGFVTEDSYSAIQLMNYEKRVRHVADLIKARRVELLANEPNLVAAE